MFSRSLIMVVPVLVGLSTAVAVHAQQEGSGSMGCCCCGSGMREGSGSMAGMAGMGKEEMGQQSLTKGRKKAGEQFTCPVDGMRMKVTENTPATEYRGKTYYFCNEQDKQTFLQDPERYVKRQSTR